MYYCLACQAWNYLEDMVSVALWPWCPLKYFPKTWRSSNRSALWKWPCAWLTKMKFQAWHVVNVWMYSRPWISPRHPQLLLSCHVPLLRCPLQCFNANSYFPHLEVPLTIARMAVPLQEQSLWPESLIINNMEQIWWPNLPDYESPCLPHQSWSAPLIDWFRSY